MAIPDFRGVLRVYKLPDGDTFGADLPASARGAWRHNGEAYLYNGDKTLGYYFAESQLELVDEMSEPDNMAVSWEATDIGTWSISQTYPHNSEIAEWLLENVRPSLALRPRNFVVLKIVSADDDDTSDDFADPLLGEVIASAPVSTATGAVLTPPVPLGRMPEWTKRGMSGFAMSVSWGPVAGGIRLTLRGVSVLWWLQATAHIRDITDLTGTSPASWGEFLSATLTANANYTISEFAESLFGGPDAAGSQSYQVSLTDDALSGTEIVSPTGLNSLVIASEAAVAGAPTLLAKGGHNLLQTIQRAVEQQELWLDGSTNILRVRPFGGTETSPKLVWDADDFFGEPELSDEIPKATAFNVGQYDYRRNWHVYAFAPHIAAVFGHIQKSLVSIAPKPQSFADEATWSAAAARAAILRTSDELTLNHIKAQAKAEALAEADNLYGSGMLRWHDGTRVGIDFWVGDIVEVRFGGSDAFSSVRGNRRGLVVRKVSMALDGNRRWGVNVGFGALADVAPRFNPDRVELPTASRSPTSFAGVGVPSSPSQPSQPSLPAGSGGMKSPISPEMEAAARQQQAGSMAQPPMPPADVVRQADEQRQTAQPHPHHRKPLPRDRESDRRSRLALLDYYRRKRARGR